MSKANKFAYGVITFLGVICFIGYAYNCVKIGGSK